MLGGTEAQFHDMSTPATRMLTSFVSDGAFSLSASIVAFVAHQTALVSVTYSNQMSAI